MKTLSFWGYKVEEQILQDKVAEVTEIVKENRGFVEGTQISYNWLESTNEWVVSLGDYIIFDGIEKEDQADALRLELDGRVSLELTSQGQLVDDKQRSLLESLAGIYTELADELENDCFFADFVDITSSEIEGFTSDFKNKVKVLRKVIEESRKTC